MISFEVRQQVKTVRKSWLEVVCSNEIERIVRLEYERLVKEFPEEPADQCRPGRYP